MNWFTSLFSSGASTVIDSVGNAIDKLVTSDEEKIILKNELANSMNKFTLDMEAKSNEFEQEVTKRWLSDNEHIVTRLTRPAGFIYTYILFGVAMIADGNIGSFSIKPTYLPILETLLATYTVAYVGSRGIEKGVKYFKGGK